LTAPTLDTHRSDRVRILAAVCAAALVLPLSFSGGAVATPAISRDLASSATALNWITNAFMLSFGSLLMAAGALADRYGRKRVFTLGIALFGMISLLLSYASSVIAIDLLRAVQGMAAAAALAGGTAALAQEFDGHARARAFSVLGTTFGAGLAFGPLLAGLLAEHLGWRWIFLSSAVVAGLALSFGAAHIRETRDPNATGFDWAGAITFTGALTLFTVAVIEAPERGWTSPLIVTLFTASAAVLGAFIAIERHISRPMLDLSLFRYPRFVGVQALPVATCYCYVVLLVLLPLRFIGVEGLGAIEAGLLVMALSIPMLVVPSLAGILTRWVSAGIIAGIGLLIAAAGLYWLLLSTRSGSARAAIPALLVIGTGTGLPWGLMDGLSISVVPRERAGMATGIFSTARVAGEAIALAIVSAVLSSLTQRHLSGSLTTQSAAHSSLQIARASRRLAAGDMQHALAMFPDADPAAFLHSYTAAFGDLLCILIVITLLSAVIAFTFLGERHVAASAGSGDDRNVHQGTGAGLHEVDRA
jgi:MFS family permease